MHCVEFYSGIGGLHVALTRSSIPNAQLIRAYDWDQSACQVYTANHGPSIVSRTDISKLTANELAALGADIWFMSPSCQPYTVLNPNRARGALDPRAQSFLHVIDDVLPTLCEEGKQPRYLLVENVAGFQDSTTRTHLLDTLVRLGYTTSEFLLTPMQFGIPNSRLRYYLLAKASPLKFAGLPAPNLARKRNDAGVEVEASSSPAVLTYIPGQGDPWIDDRLSPAAVDDPKVSDSQLPGGELASYLDKLTDNEYETYKIPDKVLSKWGRLFDIVLPSARRTCCFTRGYTQLVERAGSILQMNEEMDTTETFDRFLALQRAGDSSTLDVLRPLRLRYFTPTELLRLFRIIGPRSNDNGEDQEFKWPENISLKTKYRLIGNSVNVEVVRRLIDYMYLEPDGNGQ
ncbi:S-adenosyl-L-methionine-dependent methyltransferase [Coniophora puteana RWD-64-598 SS2]|uniref:tRNA (cytosine(38)-C(5))-methyltransferase n=1 Tax=Coniophora puteana (strain RWD-64-598) TaxID=741705 RepID=A0A5M3N4B3_CONPW|nr:S-adenosyl-L-methionine-dependent methyltransferase [Coniophora puteana RWD-64-598 SS2]EIW86233.1 S-adenosyl-L-methionine-dependent methyltransferase [Coniophora puteana RWD-64-598 SS2]